LFPKVVVLPLSRLCFQPPPSCLMFPQTVVSPLSRLSATPSILSVAPPGACLAFLLVLLQFLPRICSFPKRWLRCCLGCLHSPRLLRPRLVPRLSRPCRYYHDQHGKSRKDEKEVFSYT
jgi:hypothetical protein